MKKIAFFIALLCMYFLFILGEKPIYSNTFSQSIPASISSQTPKNFTTDTSLLNYANYLLLQKYILINGRSEQVNISSIISRPKYITYHILKFNNWQLTIDHSARIYCSLLAPKYMHLGNILEDEGKGILIETDIEDHRTQIKNMLYQLVQMMHHKK